MCTHHWIIDPPNGPTSTGRCRLCGATKQFTNNWDINYKDSLTATMSGKKRTMKRTKRGDRWEIY